MHTWFSDLIKFFCNLYKKKKTLNFVLTWVISHIWYKLEILSVFRLLRHILWFKSYKRQDDTKLDSIKVYKFTQKKKLLIYSGGLSLESNCLFFFILIRKEVWTGAFPFLSTVLTKSNLFCNFKNSNHVFALSGHFFPAFYGISFPKGSLVFENPDFFLNVKIWSLTWKRFKMNAKTNVYWKKVSKIGFIPLLSSKCDANQITPTFPQFHFKINLLIFFFQEKITAFISSYCHSKSDYCPFPQIFSRNQFFKNVYYSQRISTFKGWFSSLLIH